MRKSCLIPTSIVAFILTISTVSAYAGGGYAEDRALIEDLAARYLFALDFRDAKTYSETFTEDGILDYGTGEIKGRKAIFELIEGMGQRARETAAKDTSGLRPAKGSHNISNMVIKVEGNTGSVGRDPQGSQRIRNSREVHSGGTPAAREETLGGDAKR